MTHDHLSRLDRNAYRGQAHVSWTLCLEQRRTGWLTPVFYYHFRELLTHTMFRYAVACPIYCLMPDHLHLLWIGIEDQSDQVNAMKFLRKRMNESLERIGYRLQHQCFDHVLRDDERLEHGFEAVVDYIARNPERKGLVPLDGFASYRFTGCLVPGYPELKLWTADHFPRFWRCYSFLRKNGIVRKFGESVA